MPFVCSDCFGREWTNLLLALLFFLQQLCSLFGFLDDLTFSRDAKTIGEASRKSKYRVLAYIECLMSIEGVDEKTYCGMSGAVDEESVVSARTEDFADLAGPRDEEVACGCRTRSSNHAGMRAGVATLNSESPTLVDYEGVMPCFERKGLPIRLEDGD